MDRFTVRYWIAASDESEARTRALEIALEQTVEIPRNVVPSGYVEDVILGKLESLAAAPAGRGGFIAGISYSDDDTGGDFLQFLNILFGNSSIKPGIRVEGLDLSHGLEALCAGPAFGAAGLRARAGLAGGPVLMSAIKPVGLSTAQLARLAGQFAAGGMDYVKDDHGLVNQKTSPFEERVRACVDAVGDANGRTGNLCSFVPNITGTARHMFDRAHFARDAGAGGVMVAPSLAGFDVAHALAADPDFDIPVVSHPSFAGANVITPTTGFAHDFYFGTLSRLMGVDAVVYPNFGGRFGFSREECVGIARACSAPLSHLKAILPAPGGGMTFQRVPEMLSAYGDDVMYLMGGALLQEPDLTEACRRLVAAVRG